MEPPVFNYLLLKLATRCNLNCTYCYWFRDNSVYEMPPVLTASAEKALLERLKTHIEVHELKYFSILFHGGEPLLFGKRRFIDLAESLEKLTLETGCRIPLSITTNGTLVDDDWASLFRIFNVHVTLSIDGPQEAHDSRRVTRRGAGSYGQVVGALDRLRAEGLEPGVLAVCDPLSDPKVIADHFIKSLDLKHFDILVPDATHEDTPISISRYYNELFDLWYDDYWPRGVEIRYPRALLKGLLGGESHLESIGYGPIQTVALLTDGSLEPLDVLRIAGEGSTKTNLNIQTHTFQDVVNDPVWRRAFDAALNLCDECEACQYRTCCGGGFLPHRWSNDNGYNNPSVYCSDLKDVFSHIWSRVSQDISVTSQNGTVSLSELYSSATIQTS